MNSNLNNYLNYQAKFKRMDEIIDEWAMRYQIEKLIPLLKEGFEYDEIVEYFAAKLSNWFAPTRCIGLIINAKQREIFGARHFILD